MSRLNVKAQCQGSMSRLNVKAQCQGSMSRLNVKAQCQGSMSRLSGRATAPTGGLGGSTPQKLGLSDKIGHYFRF
jgi:hypothetical protein